MSPGDVIGCLRKMRERMSGDSERRKRTSRTFTARRVESLEARLPLAMAGVDVISSAFAPNPVTIHVGDTVEWVWDSNDLGTTSVAGSVEQWDSGVHNTGFVFDHTFTHTGTFDYYSTVGGSDNGNGTASGMSGQIIVLPPSPIMMVMVTPPTFTLNPGGTQQYMAMAMYDDNTMEMINSDVTWTSSNPTIATVSTSVATAGLVRANAVGSAQIIASIDGMEASAPIVVTVPPPPPPLVDVTGVQTVLSKRGQVKEITIGFTGPLNASQADNVALYRLVLPGAKGSFRARTAKAVKVRSAVYDASTNTVALALQKPLPLARQVQLTIDGEAPSGLEDNQGRLIDGNRDGNAGSNATIVFTPELPVPQRLINRLSMGGHTNVHEDRTRGSS
jgi:plastocyanin